MRRAEAGLRDRVLVERRRQPLAAEEDSIDHQFAALLTHMGGQPARPWRAVLRRLSRRWLLAPPFAVH